jgi:AraC family transcriptional regulator, regulatory protein of adaptative response / methylated-DNA-[protein]-cysteine methyltransferase
MRKAFLAKDSTFEGVFYVAVKTTGIFCRPTCTAKTPKSENIEFFPTPKEALYRGYRPCLRCKPLQNGRDVPETVKTLLAAVQKNSPDKITTQGLKKMGIDPSTARRQFQRYYGMTFQEYQRATRMGLALRQIHGGETVIGAQLDSGFQSASGFWDAFKKVFGVPPSKAASVDCLKARWFETPVGPMIALADDKGLYLFEFVDRRGLENEILFIRKRTKLAILPGNNKLLDEFSKEIDRYFTGKNLAFSVPLKPTGSEFEHSVWKQLRLIPPGTTTSYSAIAKKIGKPDASRAVGHANGRNCIAIVIPCHRVINADGSISNYGGGVWRKRWLISHELKSKTG